MSSQYLVGQQMLEWWWEDERKAITLVKLSVARRTNVKTTFYYHPWRGAICHIWHSPRAKCHMHKIEMLAENIWTNLENIQKYKWRKIHIPEEVFVFTSHERCLTMPHAVDLGWFHLYYKLQITNNKFCNCKKTFQCISVHQWIYSLTLCHSINILILLTKKNLCNADKASK